ncbi:helix-turn-helix domain-containing protein [Enterobacter hormaechei]|uniref:helix-turn-helix domain-containing protein n=1 Tax=Enterobacter hormaechei TaxID=158836 RepID=UPI0018C286CB|nr:helix-turn-helix domain-containing protein [Enterobacter hormaechei]HCM9635930.1 helix-turn-helix domain-containing protein [Enterobacter hormaechei subsp. steigerwaltii]ELB7320995.1 helix-turn-helix domain-containing protein [Enterobacter hormaechei]MBG0594595.1 helix-turn-helix domain-containing protein [Enterobacter hormaechei]MCM7322915.1 helix-turn-helix domain-containing protein [Enterobacter hormaechei]MCM7371806.1 helix-turn-helix domain-containing protein [Enterobacter hormaechei]
MKKMTVKAIVEWIEENVSSGISIDDIVRFSGYSRRHIHEIFKEYVNMSPGQYIRHRRLSRAAIRLRLTSQSAIDIAYQLAFDSQQSFSREFKKLFGVSPREYRNRECWDLNNLKTPFDFNLQDLPELRLVELPEMNFVGYEVNYSEFIRDKPIDSNPLRMDAVVRNLNYYKEDVYLLSSFEPIRKNDNKLDIKTFIGTKYQEGKQTRMVKTQKNGPGLYASLTFMGSWEDYSSVSRRIYMEMLPKYNLKRRNGVDIELFRFIGNTSIAEDNWFEVEYYIPVTY